MNELQVLKIEELNIKTEFAPIKAELETILTPYREIVVTEDTVKTCKADATKLNKLAKAINEKKIAVKKEYTKDLLVFEEECMGMNKNILEVRQTILDNSEIFIQKQREGKRIKVLEIIAEITKEKELETKYACEIGVLDSYLNASTTLKSIRSDITTKAIMFKSTQDAEKRNYEMVLNHIATTNDLLGLDTPLTQDDFKRFLTNTAELDVSEAMAEINRVGKSRKEAEDNAKKKAIEAEKARVLAKERAKKEAAELAERKRLEAERKAFEDAELEKQKEIDRELLNDQLNYRRFVADEVIPDEPIKEELPMFDPTKTVNLSPEENPLFLEPEVEPPTFIEEDRTHICMLKLSFDIGRKDELFTLLFANGFDYEEV